MIRDLGHERLGSNWTWIVSASLMFKTIEANSCFVTVLFIFNANDLMPGNRNALTIKVHVDLESKIIFQNIKNEDVY